MQLASTLAPLADLARARRDGALLGHAERERAKILQRIGPETNGLDWARVAPTVTGPLSEREQAVVRLIAQGFTNQQIAAGHPGGSSLVELSIQIEGFAGLTWPRWKRLVSEVERHRFAGLYCCDHYSAPGTIGVPSLEMTLALTYLADHSQRLRFGPLVAPLSYRDPVMLARQAMALDDLSGGRMVLGIGAGWIEDEHHRFGYDFGDARTRIDRLAEGLEVITRLCRDEGPVTFEGRFYRLWEAQLAPRSPKPGGPTILVGGKGMRRLLPLIARFADVWTSSRLPVGVFRERTQLLDELLQRQDRPRQAVKRTIMDMVVCWRDEAELERRIGFARRLRPDFAALATTELLEALRTLLGHVIDGAPEIIVQEIRAYEAAGVQEIMIDWFELDDVEGLQVLAEEVLPKLTTSTRTTGLEPV